MSSGRGGGTGENPKKEFPPANSSYRDVSTSMVIQTDRSEIIRRDKEAGSDVVESIWGRVNVSEMGSRAGREAAPRASTNNNTKSVLGLRSGKKSTLNSLYELDDEVELKYRPKTRETQAAYEHILTYLQQLGDFSDQPAAVVRSVTEEVLIILKSTEDSWKDLDRKVKVEEALGVKTGEISSEKYAQLVNLARRVTDFSVDEGESYRDNDGTQEVAVVFDDQANGSDQDENDEEDFGEISNLVDKDLNDEDDSEDEAEFEKTLPAVARRNMLDMKKEEKVLDLESLAFPDGNFLIFHATFIYFLL